MIGQMKLLSEMGAVELSWVWVTAIFFSYVLTWYSCLKHIKVSTAACILSLGAPIMSLLDMAWKKSFDWQVFYGSLIMFLGVVLVMDLISKFRKARPNSIL